MKHSSYFDILSNHLKILKLFIQKPAVGQSDPWPIACWPLHRAIVLSHGYCLSWWLCTLPLFKLFASCCGEIALVFQIWNPTQSCCVHHMGTKILAFQICTQSLFLPSFPESLSPFSQVFLTSLLLWAHFTNSQQSHLTSITWTSNTAKVLSAHMILTCLGLAP